MTSQETVPLSGKVDLPDGSSTEYAFILLFVAFKECHSRLRTCIMTNIVLILSRVSVGPVVDGSASPQISHLPPPSPIRSGSSGGGANENILPDASSTHESPPSSSGEKSLGTLRSRTSLMRKKVKNWNMQISALKQVLDVVYENAENDNSIPECEEVVLHLQIALKDFRELANRIEKQKDYEKERRESPGKPPPAISWEMRKLSPRVTRTVSPLTATTSSPAPRKSSPSSSLTAPTKASAAKQVTDPLPLSHGASVGSGGFHAQSSPVHGASSPRTVPNRNRLLAGGKAAGLNVRLKRENREESATITSFDVSEATTDDEEHEERVAWLEQHGKKIRDRPSPVEDSLFVEDIDMEQVGWTAAVSLQREGSEEGGVAEGPASSEGGETAWMPPSNLPTVEQDQRTPVPATLCEKEEKHNVKNVNSEKNEKEEEDVEEKEEEEEEELLSDEDEPFSPPRRALEARLTTPERMRASPEEIARIAQAKQARAEARRNSKVLAQQRKMRATSNHIRLVTSTVAEKQALERASILEKQASKLMAADARHKEHLARISAAAKEEGHKVQTVLMINSLSEAEESARRKEELEQRLLASEARRQSSLSAVVEAAKDSQRKDSSHDSTGRNSSADGIRPSPVREDHAKGSQDNYHPHAHPHHHAKDSPTQPLSDAEIFHWLNCSMRICALCGIEVRGDDASTQMHLQSRKHMLLSGQARSRVRDTSCFVLSTANSNDINQLFTMVHASSLEVEELERERDKDGRRKARKLRQKLAVHAAKGKVESSEKQINLSVSEADVQYVHSTSSSAGVVSTNPSESELPESAAASTVSGTAAEGGIGEHDTKQQHGRLSKILRELDARDRVSAAEAAEGLIRELRRSVFNALKSEDRSVLPAILHLNGMSTLIRMASAVPSPPTIRPQPAPTPATRRSAEVACHVLLACVREQLVARHCLKNYSFLPLINALTASLPFCDPLCTGQAAVLTLCLQHAFAPASALALSHSNNSGRCSSADNNTHSSSGRNSRQAPSAWVAEEQELVVLRECHKGLAAYAAHWGLIHRIARFFLRIPPALLQMEPGTLPASSSNSHGGGGGGGGGKPNRICECALHLCLLLDCLTSPLSLEPVMSEALVTALKETNLAAIPTLLSSMLASRRSIHGAANSSWMDDAPREDVSMSASRLSLAATAIRTLNNVQLAAPSFATDFLVVDEVNVQLWRWVCSSLLDAALFEINEEGNNRSTEAYVLLHEVILLLGLAAASSRSFQASLALGGSETVLQKLAALPIQYFSDKRYVDILFPTLLVLIYDCERNLNVLQTEMSLDPLSRFVSECLDDATRHPDVKKGGKGSTNGIVALNNNSNNGTDIGGTFDRYAVHFRCSLEQIKSQAKFLQSLVS